MKAFIFDLDGVLVFTDQFHYQAWKQIADRLGIAFDEQINNRLRGVSRADSLEIILEGYHGAPLSEAEKQALMEEKNEIYRGYLAEMTPDSVDASVRETLQELRRQGHKLAVGSSSRNTKYILKQTDLTQQFDAISDGTNITHSKPHPEVFLKAAQYLGEQPANCIVVEDAEAGIDAAKAAGMTAVGIGDAARYERTDIRITTLRALLNVQNTL
ncbi:MAG: beta-phosphoglucomutase [Lachnospiraceae bacterium]|nr:beta-phosphoglucomutase [Lachnospiraceae bacterium]